MEVDWAGSTLKVTDRSTGENLTAYVFIATLPYSQYSYVEAFLDIKSANWLIAHIHALEYFGGVPETLVPDNLKTGVTKASRKLIEMRMSAVAELCQEQSTNKEYQTMDFDDRFSLLVNLEFVENSIAELDKKLDLMVAPYESAISLLCTIPGIKRNSAITIISGIGTDMSQFNSSKHLCCWAGLTPGNNESAGKKKSVRITRTEIYLKPALVQCAHAAVKSNEPSYFKTRYERIYKRRGKKDNYCCRKNDADCYL